MGRARMGFAVPTLLATALGTACGGNAGVDALAPWLSESPTTVAFTGSYTGYSPGWNAERTYEIVGREPAAPGEYPVLIYTVGTFGAHTAPTALAFVEAAAEAGFVAASVEYSNGPTFGCPNLRAKAERIYDQALPDSALAFACGLANADCSKGVVSVGHSQGAWMAELAADYGADVRATVGLGSGLNARLWGGDHSECIVDDRVLPDDRLRIVNGESEPTWSRTHAGMIAQLNAMTGRGCAATELTCVAEDGSGWLLAPDAEVTDGEAEHCYMGIGGCGVVDPVWVTGDAPWTIAGSLAFLSAHVDP